MLGFVLGRGGRRIVWLAPASALLASCATTSTNSERTASLEASRESEAAARAQGRRDAQQTQERALAAFRSLMTRESSEPLRERAFQAGVGFRGVIDGASDVAVARVESGHSVQFSIGAAEPVECVVFDQRGDPANILRAVYERMRGGFVRSRIESIDAGVVSGNGYLDATVVYNANVRGQLMLGAVKLRSLTAGGRNVLCTHDEPGFRQGFHRALLPLMRGASRAPRDADYVVSAGEHNIGVVLVRNREEDGATVEESFTSMLFAGGDGALTAIDAASIERYAPDGTIESLRQIESENLALTNNVWQREGDTLRYRFEGTHLGRPHSGVAYAREPLRAENPRLASFVRRALASRGAALAPLEYEQLNRANPLSVHRSRIEFARAEGSARVWLTVTTPRFTSRMLVDADGAIVESHSEIGRVPVAMRRVDTTANEGAAR
jgi:hypothetical protein